jgi:hypothetical protein
MENEVIKIVIVIEKRMGEKYRQRGSKRYRKGKKKRYRK